MAPVNIIYFLSQKYFYFFVLVNTELYKCRSLSIIKKTTTFSKMIQNFKKKSKFSIKKSKFSTKIFKILNFQHKKTFAHQLFLFVLLMLVSEMYFEVLYVYIFQSLT